MPKKTEKLNTYYMTVLWGNIITYFKVKAKTEMGANNIARREMAEQLMSDMDVFASTIQ